MNLAFETAASSVAADERDPAGHWALGRALWLRGALREAVSELQRSVELSPNFALGHYMLGFVEAQSGDPMSAIASTNTSRELSPFDPLQFGMLASRALAHLRLGETEEAVEWALKAIARPNAHAHILAIAAATLSLAGRHEDARALVGRMRERDGLRLGTVPTRVPLRSRRRRAVTEERLGHRVRRLAVLRRSRWYCESLRQG